MGGMRSQFKGLMVSGLFIVSQLECMGPFKPFAEKILASEGIVNPAVGQWYDAEAFLKVFDDMDNRFGDITCYQIGKKTLEHAPFPPEVNDVEGGLVGVGMAYNASHKGPDIGYVRYVKTGERSGMVVVNNPFPCGWCRGAIASAAERFKKPGQVVKVTHDDSKPCRDKGGETCTYNVTW